MTTRLKNQPKAELAVRGPSQKKGRVQGTQSQSVLAELRLPESKDIGELATAMRRDYQVSLGERVIAGNVRSAAVSHTAEHSPNAGPRDRQRGNLLADQLQNLWTATQKSMLDCFAEGRVAYEKVNAFDAASALHTFAKLQALPFAETELCLQGPDSAEPGAFDGIKLRDEKLPAEKCWWLALDPTPLEPHGRSRFMGAPHEVWKDRREAKKLRALFLKRFCLGGGVAHVPESILDEDGNKVDVFAATGKAYDDLLSGGLMLFPNDRAGPDGTGEYEYDYQPAPNTVNDGRPLIDLLVAMDAEQLLAFAIPPKTVIEGDAVGSFALVTQQMLVLLAVVEDILDQLVESWQRYVVAKSISVNFDEAVAPKITCAYTKLTEKPDSLAVEVVKAWLTLPQLSPVLASGAVDVGAVLELVGIPVSADVSARLQKMVQAASAVVGAVPSPGGPVPAPLATGQGGLKPSEPVPVTPVPPVPKPTTPVAGSGQPGQPGTVEAEPAALALNGAQVTSLLDIVERVTTGLLPEASALGVIEAAFPALPPAVLSKILAPLRGFIPRAASLAVGTPVPGGPLDPFLKRRK